MNAKTVKSGCNRREAIQLAHRLGLTIEPVRRTGEVRVTDPLEPNKQGVIVNNRRKDSNRSLTVYLRRAIERRQQ